MTYNGHQNIYIGTQPIRVLQSFIPFTFENANPDVLNLTNHLTDKLKFNPGLQYPNEIHIHETFLSYVWCISYSLITLYNTAHPSDGNCFTENEIDKRAKLIDEIFSYGTSLIDNFSTWDKQKLPNPEIYDKKDEKRNL